MITPNKIASMTFGVWYNSRAMTVHSGNIPAATNGLFVSVPYKGAGSGGTNQITYAAPGSWVETLQWS